MYYDCTGMQHTAALISEVMDTKAFLLRGIKRPQRVTEQFLNGTSA